MTKIVIDKALIDQAIDALQNHQGNYKLSKSECKKQEAVEDALLVALVEPAEVPLLTEKEMLDCACHNLKQMTDGVLFNFARAIEAAVRKQFGVNDE